MTGKKTGGRQKGTPNRATADLRAFVLDLLERNKRQILKDFKQLEPAQRVSMFEKLMQYCLPKQQASRAEIDFARLDEAQIDMIISEITRDIDL